MRLPGFICTPYSSSNERSDPPEWDEFQPGNDRYINGRKSVIFGNTSTSALRATSAKKAGSTFAWSPCSLLLNACGGVQTTKRTTHLQSTVYGYSVLRTPYRELDTCDGTVLCLCCFFFSLYPTWALNYTYRRRNINHRRYNTPMHNDPLDSRMTEVNEDSPTRGALRIPYPVK